MKLVFENMYYLSEDEKDNGKYDLEVSYNDPEEEDYEEIELCIGVKIPFDGNPDGNNKTILINGINNLIALRSYLDDAISHFEKSLEKKHECYKLK